MNVPEASLGSIPLKSSEMSPWWNVALTLGHLETRLHAAKLLDSPSEFKTNLILYAKRIAEEGFRAKAEELLKELCGPLYWLACSLIRGEFRILMHPWFPPGNPVVRNNGRPLSLACRSENCSRT